MSAGFGKVRRPVRREHPGVVQRKNVAAIRAMIPPENQAKFDADFPESNLTPLPKKRGVIRRPVDGKPVYRSEHQEQADVIRWWNVAHKQYALPYFALFAVPNGGARDVITGSRLKAEGVRRGALDLILAKPKGGYSGLFIEMKVGNNKPTDEQEQFIDYLANAGYVASVHWTAGSAIAAIEEYLGATI